MLTAATPVAATTAIELEAPHCCTKCLKASTTRLFPVPPSPPMYINNCFRFSMISSVNLITSRSSPCRPFIVSFTLKFTNKEQTRRNQTEAMMTNAMCCFLFKKNNLETSPIVG
eukprot:Pompholyxophrys_punicea_v1_NODE_295_length_2346_cov_50.108250.p2 type:complete len:114 gc:universal NODE_295_length_2346_cov_50.108250:2071-1730(-)